MKLGTCVRDLLFIIPSTTTTIQSHHNFIMLIGAAYLYNKHKEKKASLAVTGPSTSSVNAFKGDGSNGNANANAKANANANANAKGTEEELELLRRMMIGGQVCGEWHSKVSNGRDYPWGRRSRRRRSRRRRGRRRKIIHSSRSCLERGCKVELEQGK